jgi:two-component system, LytTR family, response regulator
MIKTVIIDDEPLNIKWVANLVETYCPSLQLAGTADDLTDALYLIEEQRPSLLLLDIEFPAGTVFSLLEKLTLKNFHVIFITAHNTYATEAFRENAIDYILKPVTKESLVGAVKRLETKIQNESAPDVSKLADLIKSGWNQPAKIPLPSADGILFIDDADIIRCEASGRYTVFYLQDGKKLMVTKNLKEIGALLHPQQFFRVHHSHIINLKKLVKYHRAGMVELSDGSQVDVSSSRKEALLSLLMNKPGY